MLQSEEMARVELIRQLHKAARVERAQTVRRLLRKLLQRGAADRMAWQAPSEPAIGDCR
jgi:hypothetical protein